MYWICVDKEHVDDFIADRTLTSPERDALAEKYAKFNKIHPEGVEVLRANSKYDYPVWGL